VGVHEGRAVHWMFSNLAPNGCAMVVDDFKYEDCVYYRGKPVRVPPVKKTFESAMKDLGRAVVPSKTGKPTKKTDVALVDDVKNLKCQYDYFDFVYIDSRSSKQVLDALVRVFPLVKPGGIIVITNNVNGRLHDPACPRRGITGFLDAFVTDIKVVREGFHTFVEKRKTPVPLPHPCRYEIFDGQESFDKPKCQRQAP